MQADYSERAVAEHTIDLLIVDGALVGLVETILRPDHLWIENVAVAPERQGRGFGRLLLGSRRASRRSRLGVRNPPADQSGVRGQSRTLREASVTAIDRTEPFRGGTTRSYEQADRAAVTPAQARRREPARRLDCLRGRFHDCGHENPAAKIRADGGHPAPGLFDRRLSDGRKPRRQGLVLGRAAGARDLPARWAHRLAQPRQDGAVGSIPGGRRPRVRNGRARLRRA